ncbi:hypothetical protein, partial [Hymenobacter defluvii]
ARPINSNATFKSAYLSALSVFTGPSHARVLKKYEPNTLPSAIGAYLLREHRWNTSHALYVQGLVQMLQNGQTFQGGDRTGLNNLYKQWKSSCK